MNLKVCLLLRGDLLNMNKGYLFERECELWFCEVAGQDPKESPDKRSYRTPSSGAIRGIKGDIRTKIDFLPSQLLVECKARGSETKKDGSIVRLEKEWFTKAAEEAEAEGCIPVVLISFKGSRQCRIWAALTRQDCEKLKIPSAADHIEFEAVGKYMKIVRDLICPHDQVWIYWGGRIYVFMKLDDLGRYLKRWDKQPVR